MNRDRGPDAEQIEIDLFGPGYGESCLVHLGFGSWVVIDSCIDRRTKSPAALEYLRAIGLSPKDAIKLVIATHWHDDHIRGLSEIVEECSAAKFCCPIAFCKKEFLKLVEIAGERRSIEAGSGVDEFYRIFHRLAEESGERLQYAMANRRVFFESSLEETDDGSNTEIWTLSPSDSVVSHFLKTISSLIPEPADPKHRFVPLQPNLVSVVSYVKALDKQVLMGGDLEEQSPYKGWTNIVTSKERPKVSASIFKVPHHGSKNGHCDEVWESLLEDMPIAVATPFRRGSVRLPSENDRARLRRYAHKTHITQKNSSERDKTRYPTAVEKTLRDMRVTLKEVEPPTGQIRLKSTLDRESGWVCEYFNGAGEM